MLFRWHTQGHFVTISLLHMEEWYNRAGGKDTAGVDVKKLRNSLEHLVDAKLDWDRAVPDPASKRKQWAINDLPGGHIPLEFDLHMIDRIFGLIDLDEALTRATDVYCRCPSSRAQISEFLSPT